jgi:glutamyl-tRNA reductase
MRIGVIGINHKLADLKLRELLAKACQRRFGAGQSTHGHHHFVLLSTCNRTEIYFCSDELAETHTYLLSILRHEVGEEFDQKLYSYFGQDCFMHLSRVAAGLDSAIVAETEIQGQVKSAYESVIEYHNLPKELHYLFQKSLKIGKKIRSELPMQRGLPDIEHAILNTGLHLFEEPKKTNILFVGASEINQKILSFLKTKNLHNITLCNRSSEHAVSLAKTHNLDVMEWNRMTHWHCFDWIILGTKSPEYLITTADTPPHLISQKLIIDLCVPRNVEPNVGRHPRITLLNIDQINRSLHIRKQRMNHTLTKAEQLVVVATKQHIDLFQQKQKVQQHLLAVGA